MLTIVRPRPSRLLSAFYMNLGLTLLHSRMVSLGASVRFIDLTFTDGGLEELERAPPRILMMSLMIDDFGEGLRILREVKARSPDTLVFVGGPHITLLGESVYQLTQDIDYVCLGDCLEDAAGVVADILAGREPRPCGVIRASGSALEHEHLDIDPSFWSAHRYFPVFPFEFSRGCRHRCPFCTDPVLRKGASVDHTERAMRRLSTLVERHGARHVRFVDSSLTSLQPELDRFLERLIAEQLPVQWGAYAYPSDISEPLARRLRKAGCVALFLGVESLSPKVITGKRFQKDTVLVGRAVQLLRDQGIHVHCNLIVGLPGEDASTAEHTLQGMAAIRPDSIGGGPFFLTPGSTFHQRLRQFGIELLDPDWVVKQHLGFYDHSYEYFRTASLEQSTMRRMAESMRKVLDALPGVYWNMSDYPLLCWLSLGGSVEGLKQRWKAGAQELDAHALTLVSLLKEKSGLSLTARECRQLVTAALPLAQARPPAGASTWPLGPGAPGAQAALTQKDGN